MFAKFSLLAAFGTQTAQSQFNRIGFEFRATRRFLKQFFRNGQFQINQFSATVANRVIVSGQFPVVQIRVRADI